MTNEELKALALAATPGPWEHRFVEGDGASGAICHEHGWVADDFTDQSFKDTAYMAAANPAAVLGLIADIERLNEDRERIRSQRMEYASKYEQAIEDCDQLKAELEQAKADGNDVWGLAQGRADTIDQLKAELATERQRRWDGNESTSREHAEEIRALKAECEGLRKDAERYRFVVDCPIRTMVALGRKAHEVDFDLSAECDRLMNEGGQSNE